jgi:hypothetical protein
MNQAAIMIKQNPSPAGTVIHLLLSSFLTNYRHLKQVDKSLKKARTKESRQQLTDEFEALMFSTIISASLLLEGYINEFGAQGLNVYFDKYLDRLDLLSKWVLLLRLIEGIDLEVNPLLLARMSSLISARNRLVHPKLFWIPADDQKAKLKWKKVASQWQQLQSVARDSIRTIRDVARFMEKHSRVNEWAMVISFQANELMKER